MYLPAYRFLARSIVARALTDWRDWGRDRKRAPYLPKLEHHRPYYTADSELLEFFYSQWAILVFELADFDIREIMRGAGIPFELQWEEYLTMPENLI